MRLLGLWVHPNIIRDAPGCHRLNFPPLCRRPGPLRLSVVMSTQVVWLLCQIYLERRLPSEPAAPWCSSASISWIRSMS